MFVLIWESYTYKINTFPPTTTTTATPTPLPPVGFVVLLISGSVQLKITTR